MPQKGTGIGYLGAREAIEVIEAVEVLRPRKSLLMTSVIQAFEFSFSFMF